MNYSLYNRLYLQACDSRTAPEFVADSGAAADVLDLYGDDLTALSRDLTAIWHVAHEGPRYIRTALKMTQRELSAAFGIPSAVSRTGSAEPDSPLPTSSPCSPSPRGSTPSPFQTREPPTSATTAAAAGSPPASPRSVPTAAAIASSWTPPPPPADPSRISPPTKTISTSRRINT